MNLSISVLQIDPKNDKAQGRKIKALCSLGNFTHAQYFANQWIQNDPSVSVEYYPFNSSVSVVYYGIDPSVSVDYRLTRFSRARLSRHPPIPSLFSNPNPINICYFEIRYLVTRLSRRFDISPSSDEIRGQDCITVLTPR